MMNVFEMADADRLLRRANELGRRTAELRYLAAFLREGPQRLIAAADLPRFVVETESQFVPVVVNDDHEALCYLLSPHVHYVAYMQAELAKIRGNRTARLMSGAVGLLGRVVAPLGFNRCVSVNNWLFTTSPSVALSPAALTELTEWLCRRYPHLPLVFRGIDLRTTQTRQTFEAAGYLLVINRPVFEVDMTARKQWNGRRRHVFAREQRLLDQPDLQISLDDTLKPGEERRIAELYRGLYIEKHSRYNARYTAAYFRTSIDCGIERLITVRDHTGHILAFATLRVESARLVFALVGYDLARQRAGLPLYRTMFAAALRVGEQLGLRCFLSTGNAKFKQQRGGVEWLEYEAVYQHHLPFARRMPWHLFKATLDRAVTGLDTAQI